jgi:cobalt-zinc-cadmium efflux system outer membrane protein
VAPHGTTDERVKLNTASPPFEPRIDLRQLSELPAIATWQDVLSRAFLANGELESSYFEWKAAFARIDHTKMRTASHHRHLEGVLGRASHEP